jgi:hypothetical protein
MLNRTRISIMRVFIEFLDLNDPHGPSATRGSCKHHPLPG